MIDAVVQWVEGAMAKDRKVTALKTLQVCEAASNTSRGLGSSRVNDVTWQWYWSSMA